MPKIICGKRLGNQAWNICHEKDGHPNKCYPSGGHKAEDIIQEILKSYGCEVVKAKQYEDNTLKVDAWVKDPNSGKWLPIQLTTEEAVFRTKCNLAREAGQKGNGFYIVVWVPSSAISKWEMARVSERDNIGKWIYEKFWDYVRGILKMYPSTKMAKPTTMLWRFLPTPPQ